MQVKAASPFLQMQPTAAPTTIAPFPTTEMITRLTGITTGPLILENPTGTEAPHPTAGVAGEASIPVAEGVMTHHGRAEAGGAVGTLQTTVGSLQTIVGTLLTIVGTRKGAEGAAWGGHSRT